MDGKSKTGSNCTYTTIMISGISEGICIAQKYLFLEYDTTNTQKIHSIDSNFYKYFIRSPNANAFCSSNSSFASLFTLRAENYSDHCRG